MSYKTLRFQYGGSSEFATVGTFTVARNGTHIFAFGLNSSDVLGAMQCRAVLGSQVVSSFSAVDDGNFYNRKNVWMFSYNLSVGQTISFQTRNTYAAYPNIIEGVVAY